MKWSITTAVEEFANLLRRRFESGIYTTEDSVRYTFFAALLSSCNILPDRIVLEYPHPAIPGGFLDVLILDGDRQPEAIIEFKYDRQIPSGRNQPRPQKAGAVFKDLGRLLRFPESVERYFVYLTDEELAQYFQNPQNGLGEFFDLAPGKSLVFSDQYSAGRSETLRESIGAWPGLARLHGVARESLPRNHELRVYEIELE